MGLSFLHKKEWHPGTFKNIEIVWNAEEKKKQNEKIAAENLKKLKEERHLEELKRLQVQAGIIPKSHLERMDWMYDWGNKVKQNTEEYLLGKPVDKQVLEQNNLKNDGQEKKFQAIFQEQIGNERNENFTLVHEDPIFLIRQEELKQRNQVIANPIKMKNIYEELEKMGYSKSEKSAKKEERKRLKKERKLLKKEEKKIKKEQKKLKALKEGKTEDQQKKSEQRSRSSSLKKEKKRKNKEKKRKNNSSSSSSDSSSSRSRSRSKKKQSSKTSSVSSNTMFDEYMRKKLGPILQKDEHGKYKVDFGMFKRKPQKQQLSKEELEERVNQMKQDAKQLEEQKLNQYKKDFKDKDDQEEMIDSNKKKQENDPSFLKNMKHQLYNSEKNINDLADRIGRYKNSLVRNIDRQTEAFKRN